MAALNYELAVEYLQSLFTEAEAAFENRSAPAVDTAVVQAVEALFSSSTQSYREVALGCGLARLLDPSINIRHPYKKHGDDSFNGRTLDERVINPFLNDRLIPCSKGPYLATFRRSVKLVPETEQGLRDAAGYGALLTYIGALEDADAVTARALVSYLLYRFLLLREATRIPLARISRLSLEQYHLLVAGLLQVQSGGLIPVLLTVALLRTIKECFGLSWEIEWQGINVADRAAGAGGDVTVKQGGAVILAVEVTERAIERSRVVSTFTTKILHVGINDYLFVYSAALPSDDAKQVARTYFSQGHEINFLELQGWILNALGTIGAACRGVYMQEVIELLDSRSVPAAAKVAWNTLVQTIVGT
jgi:hypothetical protein